jgi:hypothetical protein
MSRRTQDHSPITVTEGSAHVGKLRRWWQLRLRRRKETLDGATAQLCRFGRNGFAVSRRCCLRFTEGAQMQMLRD